MRAAPAYRIAADIGGTFTDVALLAADGTLSTSKVRSTPDDFAEGVLAGCRDVLARTGVAASSIGEFLHASTVATNVILEGKGARTGLVTTRGFRDVLELRRIRVPRLYEPLYRKPPPLVPRRYRFEIGERIDARGAVLERLDEEEVERVADAILAAGLEAVAVCFLNSYVNPEHERVAGTILSRKLPACFVTLSVDVLPEIREYERTSTTVINAYVAPPVSAYLRSLRRQLAELGIAAPFYMMQSSGGILDLETVLQRPALVVESGPAAGVVGAGDVARRTGYRDLITLDIGGTTAKASVVEDGRHVKTDEYEVGGGISLSSRLVKGGGYALKLPVIDVSEVGAGGGSIVSVSRAGSISVGPESAGSHPGPAAYGRGGTRPTVTDANVVLGYLNPTSIAGGSVTIDPEAARRAISDHVATPLRMAVEDAAVGVVTLANTLMLRAIRSVTTLRGRDPGTFTLIAFGGAGGLHALALAEALRIRKVLVPPAAGVFSAVGLLCSEIEYTHGRAFLHRLTSALSSPIEAEYGMLEGEVLRRLRRSAADVRMQRQADLRYAGQAFELTVDVDGGEFGPLALAKMASDFDAEHERAYGHCLADPDGRDVVALRVSGRIQATRPDLKPPPPWEAQSKVAVRPVYFGSTGWIDAPVLSLAALAGNDKLGPLILEEADSTTIVPPGWRARLDRFGGALMTFDGIEARS